MRINGAVAEKTKKLIKKYRVKQSLLPDSCFDYSSLISDSMILLLKKQWTKI